MSAILVIIPLTVVILEANAINGPLPLLNTDDTFNITQNDVSSIINPVMENNFNNNQSITAEADSKNSILNIEPIASESITDVQEKNVTLTTNSSIATPSEITESSRPKLYNKADSRKRKLEKKSIIINPDEVEWKCPNISSNRNLECGCDMPHTLRCSGDIHSLEVCYLMLLHTFLKYVFNIL